MCDVAFVIGRHVREPFIEGGGKITYLIARALSEIGIKTYLVKINYLVPDEKFYTVKVGFNPPKNLKLNELELKVGLLSQDAVLHKVSGIVVSNLIELIASPLSVVKLMKRISSREDVCIFVGNSCKLGGLFMSQLLKLKRRSLFKTLMIYKREEISRYTSRIIKPGMIFTTSKELSLRASRTLATITGKTIYSYPPLLPEETPKKVPTQKSPMLLYMGRVTSQRFPLYSLKQIAINLKNTPKEISLVIVSPPESVSLEWLKSAIELLTRLNARNRVLIISRTLNMEEKRHILSRASVFIFPGKGTVAVEPPLTVIESLAHGLYLVTTGDNSTRELVCLGAGQLVKNFAELNIEKCLDRSNKLSQKISMSAQETFSFQKLVDTLRAALIS